MSYTPTTWASGDIVTAEKLNKLEQGVSGAGSGGTAEPFVVTLTPTAADYSGTMDKTPAEIRAAYDAGREIVASIPSMGATFAFDQQLIVSNSIICAGGIYYDFSGQNAIILVSTSASASTYSTTIYYMVQNKMPQMVPDVNTVHNPGAITLDNNVEYYFTDVSNLTLTYPSGSFECLINIQTASSGTVTVTFPNGTEYIGDVPTFGNSEHWQISIKDGVVVAGKAVTPA